MFETKQEKKSWAYCNVCPVKLEDSLKFVLEFVGMMTCRRFCRLLCSAHTAKAPVFCRLVLSAAEGSSSIHLTGTVGLVA